MAKPEFKVGDKVICVVHGINHAFKDKWRVFVISEVPASVDTTRVVHLKGIYGRFHTQRFRLATPTEVILYG